MENLYDFIDLIISYYLLHMYNLLLLIKTLNFFKCVYNNSSTVNFNAVFYYNSIFFKRNVALTNSEEDIKNLRCFSRMRKLKVN